MLTPVCQPCQGNTRLYVRGDPSGEAYPNYGLCQTTWVYPVYDYQLQTTVTNTKPSVITVRVHGQSCPNGRPVGASTRGHEVPCIERAHRLVFKDLNRCCSFSLYGKSESEMTLCACFYAACGLRLNEHN